MSELEELMRGHLRDWRSGWSMGSFGAIAEFHQDQDEGLIVDDPTTFTRATHRGGISLTRERLAEITPLAYETLSPKRHRWSQALALCLPHDSLHRPQRNVLTELGPDGQAIRDVDRTDILFDMGLALPQCDFCIRTGDPTLLAALRVNLGRSLFDPSNSAMPAILSAHPHRIALTDIGRVEVYQKIGGPDTGGTSPPGPHTHLLPKLLRSGRTHSANTPIPPGLTPLAYLHPGNPLIGAMGEDRPFDLDLFHAFQSLLERYGPREMITARTSTLAALGQGLRPDQVRLGTGRFERAAIRLTLRQQKHVNGAAHHQLLDDWLGHYEGGSLSELEEDDAPGH